MSWKRICIYWLVAAILGLHLYQVGLSTVWETGGDPSSARPFVELSPVQLTALDGVLLKWADLAVELNREAKGGRWKVAAPAQGLGVTSDLIDALIDTLATIPAIEVVATDEESREQFGFDPPSAELTLSGGSTVLAALQFGRRNPTRTAVYARMRGSNTVYLLGLNAQYYVELIGDEVEKQLDNFEPG